MTDYNNLSLAFSPTTYKGFKELRGDANSPFTAVENNNSIILTTFANGLNLICILDKHQDIDSVDDYMSSLKEFANSTVLKKEVRFSVHDFSKPETWDGRTCGDPAAWFVGGVALNPMNNQWLTIAGAQALALYGADPVSNGAQLYLAFQNQIPLHNYNDIKYQWEDGNGNRLCYLDRSVSPSVWRDNNGDIIVQYDPILKKWHRKDEEGEWTIDVTSSRYRMLPYSGFKLQMKQALIKTHKDSNIDSAIRFQGFGLAGPENGAPFTGHWKGDDFEYKSLDWLALGSNNGGASADSDGIVTFLFDYDKTIPIVIDSIGDQYVDIFIDSHQPVLGTPYISASYVCMNYRSF